MMFSREDRSLWDDTKLGVLFGFYGGYFNATAIVILMYEIAPMSANWGGMAKEIGSLDKVFTYLPLILCFIFGAFSGSKFAKKYNPIYVVIVESLLFISIGFFITNTVLAVALGGLAMGLQNGMTTQISHHAVRTSHLTSTVTDIGISLARKNYKGALVKGSKTIIYMWGAVVGTLKSTLLGKAAFVFGGVYLLGLMLAWVLATKSEFWLRQDVVMERWFAPPRKVIAKTATN